MPHIALPEHLPGISSAFAFLTDGAILPARAFEQVADLGVGGLRKVVVPDTNGIKRLRRLDTDGFVGLVLKFLASAE